MKILVSGANGFLGKCVVARLLLQGHFVRALVRPASTMPADWLSNSAVEVVRADLRRDLPEDLFSGVDTVVHLAAAVTGSDEAQFESTVIGTEKFLSGLAKSAVRRIIHISSFAVYDWAEIYGTLDENSKTLSYPYGMGGYAVAKVWQERLVREAAAKNGWALVILRPGFIWDRDHMEIAALGRSFGRILFMVSPLSRLPLTHVSDCAAAIVAATERTDLTDAVFNVIDDDSVRTWRFAREYSRLHHKRLWVFPVPYRVGLTVAHVAMLCSRAFFGVEGKLPSFLVPRRYQSQFKSLRFSNAKLREVLRWRPSASFSERVSKTS